MEEKLRQLEVALAVVAVEHGEMGLHLLELPERMEPVGQAEHSELSLPIQTGHSILVQQGVEVEVAVEQRPAAEAEEAEELLFCMWDDPSLWE